MHVCLFLSITQTLFVSMYWKRRKDVCFHFQMPKHTLLSVRLSLLPTSHSWFRFFFLFVIINKHLSHYSAYLRCSLHSITLNKSNWLNNMQVHGGEHSHSASIVALCHWMHTNQLLHFVIYANHKEVFWINAINLNAYKNWIYMRLRLFRPLVCILIKFIIWNVFSIPT